MWNVQQGCVNIFLMSDMLSLFHASIKLNDILFKIIITKPLKEFSQYRHSPMIMLMGNNSMNIAISCGKERGKSLISAKDINERKLYEYYDII